MNKRELEGKIRELVKRVNADIPDDYDSETALMLAPLYFTRIDMVYLLMLIMEEFPGVKITAKDLEQRKFKSVSSIVQFLQEGLVDQ